MDTLSRRKFLLASAVVGGGALVAGGTAWSIWDILATANSPGRRPGDLSLVVVTLYGGNDGLATVIPFADPAYHDARPGLSYPADQVLHLDDTTGLNPALKGLHQLYSGQRLAIIRGVGYPNPDHSHFRSMDIWQTGHPDRPAATGWLGRWLDAVGGDPRMAVSFEPVLPPLLAGEHSAGAAVPTSGLNLPRTVSADTVTALSKPSEVDSTMQARAAGCFADLVKVDEMISAVKDTAAGPTPATTGTPAATSTGGSRSALAAQLDLVAQCVEAGVATRVFSVSLGGFDFHADEKTAQERLLGELDSAIAGFAERMAGTERGRKVVVMVYSEFGRRVRANASDGTDHGTASNVLVLGAPVLGGRFVGEQPSLTDLADGDLKASMDFRDIYATMLADVLGADPAQILDGYRGRVPALLAV